MKSIKETIIFGALFVSICIIGTIYAAHENRMRESVAPTPITTMATAEEVISEIISEPTPEPISTPAPATTISMSDKEIEKAISDDRNQQKKAQQEYQELLNTGYVKWSEPEVTPASTPEQEPTPELIPESTPAPTTVVVVASYNSKDEYYNELINSFSDWDYDTSQLEFYGSKYITGYDACESCCGKSIDDPNYGVTASLSHVKMGRTCAVNGLSFGTVLYIEGIGLRVVEDRGGMKNGNVDIYCDTHNECYAVTGTNDVWILWSPDWV